MLNSEDDGLLPTDYDRPYLGGTGETINGEYFGNASRATIGSTFHTIVKGSSLWESAGEFEDDYNRDDNFRGIGSDSVDVEEEKEEPESQEVEEAVEWLDEAENGEAAPEPEKMTPVEDLPVNLSDWAMGSILVLDPAMAGAIGFTAPMPERLDVINARDRQPETRQGSGPAIDFGERRVTVPSPLLTVVGALIAPQRNERVESASPLTASAVSLASFINSPFAPVVSIARAGIAVAVRLAEIVGPPIVLKNDLALRPAVPGPSLLLAPPPVSSIAVVLSLATVLPLVAPAPPTPPAPTLAPEAGLLAAPGAAVALPATPGGSGAGGNLPFLPKVGGVPLLPDGADLTRFVAAYQAGQISLPPLPDVEIEEPRGFDGRPAPEAPSPKVTFSEISPLGTVTLPEAADALPILTSLLSSAGAVISAVSVAPAPAASGAPGSTLERLASKLPAVAPVYLAPDEMDLLGALDTPAPVRTPASPAPLLGIAVVSSLTGGYALEAAVDAAASFASSISAGAESGSLTVAPTTPGASAVRPQTLPAGRSAALASITQPALVRPSPAAPGRLAQALLAVTLLDAASLTSEVLAPLLPAPAPVLGASPRFFADVSFEGRTYGAALTLSAGSSGALDFIDDLGARFPSGATATIRPLGGEAFDVRFGPLGVGVRPADLPKLSFLSGGLLAASAPRFIGTAGPVDADGFVPLTAVELRITGTGLQIQTPPALPGVAPASAGPAQIVLASGGVVELAPAPGLAIAPVPVAVLRGFTGVTPEDAVADIVRYAPILLNGDAISEGLPGVLVTANGGLQAVANAFGQNGGIVSVSASIPVGPGAVSGPAVLVGPEPTRLTAGNVSGQGAFAPGALAPLSLSQAQAAAAPLPVAPSDALQQFFESAPSIDDARAAFTLVPPVIRAPALLATDFLSAPIQSLFGAGIASASRGLRATEAQVASLAFMLASFSIYLNNVGQTPVQVLLDFIEPGTREGFTRVPTVSEENKLIVYDLGVEAQNAPMGRLRAAIGDALIRFQGVLPASFTDAFRQSLIREFAESFVVVRNDRRFDRLEDGFWILTDDPVYNRPVIARVAIDPENPNVLVMWTPLSQFTRRGLDPLPPLPPLNFNPGISNPNFQPGAQPTTGGALNDPIYRSFSPERRATLDRGAIETSLSRAIDAPVAGALAALASGVESAGAVILRKENGRWIPAGVKVFRSVPLETKGYPTADQVEAAAVRHPAADAFATEAGVIVLDRAYRKLGGAFVPFHTHLGHPHGFKGAARFAPTACDIRSHNALVRRFADQLEELRVPGLVFSAGGEVTIFRASENEGAGIRFEVISGVDRIAASVRLEQLEVAERTGELTVSLDGLNGLIARRLAGGVRRNWLKVDLWDRRRRV